MLRMYTSNLPRLLLSTNATDPLLPTTEPIFPTANESIPPTYYVAFSTIPFTQLVDPNAQTAGTDVRAIDVPPAQLVEFDANAADTDADAPKVDDPIPPTKDTVHAIDEPAEDATLIDAPTTEPIETATKEVASVTLTITKGESRL